MENDQNRTATKKVDISELVNALVDAGVFDLAARIRHEDEDGLMPPPSAQLH